MIKYGATASEKGGFKVVQILGDDVDADRNPIVIGYAILGPNGVEIERFSTLEQASVELEILANPNAGSAPGM